jgi:hypothetical protein
MLPSMAFAGACPMLTSQVEDKIATLDQTKHATLISIALMLHEQGMAAHSSGVYSWYLSGCTIIINKGVVRSVIEKIRLCRDRGYALGYPASKI